MQNEKGNDDSQISKNSNNKYFDQIIKLISPGKSVIFAYSFCPYCLKAAELLSNLNIKTDIVYVDKEENFKFNNEFKQALNRHSGIETYPKIYLGLFCVGGYSDLYDLFTDNKLFEILKSEGIEFIEDDYY